MRNRFAFTYSRCGKSSVAVIVVVATVSLSIAAVCIVSLAVFMQLNAVDSRRLTVINMKQIGLALHNYHDTYQSFPPAYLADEDGKPLHSWRVLILPFLQQEALYGLYDFDEPWDGPSNRMLMSQMPQVYSDPTLPRSGGGLTAYQAIAGVDTILSGATTSKFSNITDGASNTALIVENTGALVPWLCPEDTQLDAFIQGTPFENGEEGGTNILMANGAVHFLDEKTPPKTLRAISTRGGGEVQPGF